MKTRLILNALLIMVFGFLLATGLDKNASYPDDLRNTIQRNGVEETGSLNLVSAIYLGYRAFDTLGETLVLFLAVTGIVFIQEMKK